jgi:CDP-diacylglycerol pyrophosphatase
MLTLFLRLAGMAVLVIGLACSPEAGAAGRDALWTKVHEACVPHWLSGGDPSPCVRIGYSATDGTGVAILQDRIGIAQFLAIPTARIPGIESEALQGAKAPPLFQAAWDARQFMFAKLGRSLPRDSIGLAINSAVRRSQDQAHIHIDCLRPGVRDALKGWSSRIGREWSDESFVLEEAPYTIRRAGGPELTGVNPFDLAAQRLTSRGEELGRATIVVAGAGADDADPGFFILLSQWDPAHGGGGHGEDLLDHACRIAGAN